MKQNRTRSRNPEHMRHDLKTALEVAFILHPDQADTAAAGRIVASIVDHRDAQTALTMVRDQFSAAVFGAVTRFHLEAETSLMGYAEQVTLMQSLRKAGLTVADLGWPAVVLNRRYVTQAAPPNPMYESVFTSKVIAWMGAHPATCS